MCAQRDDFDTTDLRDRYWQRRRDWVAGMVTLDHDHLRRESDAIIEWRQMRDYQTEMAPVWHCRIALLTWKPGFERRHQHERL